MQTSRMSVLPITSITGATDAIAATRILVPRDTFLMTSWVTQPWMTTATGARIQAMATCGTRTFHQAGLLIARATGRGSIPGDGLGWMMSPGGMLHFTMAAGCLSKAAGVGFPAQWKWRPYMFPRS